MVCTQATRRYSGRRSESIAPQKTSLAEKISDTADVSEKAVSDTKSDDAPVKEYHGKKSTDNLIEKLNRNLAQQRKENVKAYRTITLNTINGDRTTLPHPLNIDYQKQIIEQPAPFRQKIPLWRRKSRPSLHRQRSTS